MERCESGVAVAVQPSPSLDSAELEFAQAARRGHRLAVGAFYGSRRSKVQTQPSPEGSGEDAAAACEKPARQTGACGGKFLVFYLDLSFVFLLELEKLRMARGCLCCVKYMMFLFNLLFWVSTNLLVLTLEHWFPQSVIEFAMILIISLFSIRPLFLITSMKKKSSLAIRRVLILQACLGLNLASGSVIDSPVLLLSHFSTLEIASGSILYSDWSDQFSVAVTQITGSY